MRFISLSFKMMCDAKERYSVKAKKESMTLTLLTKRQSTTKSNTKKSNHSDFSLETQFSKDFERDTNSIFFFSTEQDSIWDRNLELFVSQKIATLLSTSNFFSRKRIFFSLTQELFFRLETFDDSFVDEETHRFEREFSIFDAFSSRGSTIESEKSDSEKLSTERTEKTKIESQYSHSECSSFETEN